MRICRWYFVIYPTSRSNLGNVETWDIFKNENVEEFGIVENKNVVEFGNDNLEKVLPALGKEYPCLKMRIICKIVKFGYIFEKS